MTTLDEYIESMMDQARMLWGSDEAEKIRQHIETTATAVWRNSQTHIDVETEPATQLRHREQP